MNEARVDSNPALKQFHVRLAEYNALQIKLGETYPKSYVHVRAHCSSGFGLDDAVRTEEKKSFNRNGPPFATYHAEFHKLLGKPCASGLKFKIKPFKYVDHYHTRGDY